MENSVAALTEETEDAEESRGATVGIDHVQMPAGEAGVPENVRILIRSLIERYQLTREQFAAIYEEYVTLNSAAASTTVNHSAVGSADARSSPNVIIVTGEGITDGAEGRGGGVSEQVSMMETGLSEGGRLDGRHVEGTPEEEQFGVEIGKMQTLVQSALQSYETSPAASELGTKRKMFSLEEELNMRPTMFAQELLE